MGRDINAVKAEIEQMASLIETGTHYEILGLDRENFDSKQVGAAFRALAKKWHVDRFSGLDLGADKQKVQKIFAAINSAQRVLANPTSRASYDEELDAGDATDVANLLSADTLFLRGKSTLERGGYKGAFDMFKKANELNPDDPAIHHYLLYTEYLLIPKDKEGMPLKKTRAAEILGIFEEAFRLEENEENDMLMVFLGVSYLGAGKNNKAKRMFRDALRVNPKNRDAQRQKRLIDMRIEREENKGFLGKLMGMFNKK